MTLSDIHIRILGKLTISPFIMLDHLQHHNMFQWHHHIFQRCSSWTLHISLKYNMIHAVGIIHRYRCHLSLSRWILLHFRPVWSRASWGGHSVHRFSSSICYSSYAWPRDVYWYKEGAITGDTGAGATVKDLFEKVQTTTGTRTPL